MTPTPKDALRELAKELVIELDGLYTPFNMEQQYRLDKIESALIQAHDIGVEKAATLMSDEYDRPALGRRVKALKLGGGDKI